MAAGVALPRRGSLKAKLLQELDFRERNLREHEFTSLMFMLQSIYAALTLGDRLSMKHIQQTLALMTKTIDDYDSELFQERYLPEYERQQQELSRREKEEQLRQERAEQARREFVEKM